MVAATLADADATYSAASLVVMCSNTARNPGNFLSKGVSTRSMNTTSRSNMSTSVSVTSPCSSSGMPASCIFSSTAAQRARSVTPESELVVAPAG